MLPANRELADDPKTFRELLRSWTGLHVSAEMRHIKEREYRSTSYALRFVVAEHFETMLRNRKHHCRKANSDFRFPVSLRVGRWQDSGSCNWCFRNACHGSSGSFD